MDEKYFVIIIQNETAVIMHDYNTKNQAMAEYHTELGYRHESRTKTEACVLDRNLNRIEYGVYIAD